MFGNLSSDGLEQAQDRLGGYAPQETDIYTGKIKYMYGLKSDKGALGVALSVELENGTEYRETFYVTNRKGENFFLNQNDKTKKVPLPGFTTANDLCIIAAGKGLGEMVSEEKTIKLYDSEAKKELPKAVSMLVEAVGQKVSLGILKVLENKTEKQGDEYVPTAETRETNSVDKVFHPELKLTVAEALAGREEPEFWGKWLERNKGRLRDNRKNKDGNAGTAARPSKPGQSPAQAEKGVAPQARQSIFGKKA